MSSCSLFERTRHTLAQRTLGVNPFDLADFRSHALEERAVGLSDLRRLALVLLGQHRDQRGEGPPLTLPPALLRPGERPIAGFIEFGHAAENLGLETR